MGRRTPCGRKACLLQTHHRRIESGRLALAGRQGVGGGRGRRGKPDGAAHDRLRPGAANAERGGLSGAGRRSGTRGGSGARRRPPVSVLSRAVMATARRGHAGDPRSARRLDRGMEVRRNSRPNGQARRELAALVARRRAHFRELPRSGAARPGVAGRRRARRRTGGADPVRRCERRFACRPSVVRQSPAATRPQSRQ